MNFGILGPLVVHDDSGRRVPLGGGQQRALLALLLLHANEAVPVDEIIEELWHSEPPPSATKSVHALVSKLRRTLEGNACGGAVETGENGIVLTHAHGYVLRVGPGELDLDRFQSLLAEGRRAFAAGRPGEAANTIRDALSLWRGAPLAEFAYDSFAQVEIDRLEELRLAAVEERVEADLALGRHHELVPELEALAAENPLRERLHAQLILALYRSGRQAEALHAYQRTRRTLVDELGIDPGQALQRLEKAILLQDPSLEIVQMQAAPARFATLPAPEADAGGADARPAPSVPVRAEIERRRPSRLPLIAALGVLVAVVAAGGVYLVVRGGSTSTPVQPNSVGIIDPASNKIVGEIPVGARPGQVVAAAGGIWVANLEDRTVIRLDPTTQRLVRTISTEDAPIALTASDRFIWAVSASFTLPYATIVRRIDPRVNYCPLDLALDILRRGLSSSSWRFTCVGVVNTASVGFASLRGWRNVGQLTTGRCRRGSCRRRSGPDDDGSRGVAVGVAMSRAPPKGILVLPFSTLESGALPSHTRRSGTAS